MSGVPPTPTHRLFADVAASAPLTILTSTFDTLTEQAFDERRVPYHLVINKVTGWGSAAVVWRSPDGHIATVSPKELSVGPAETCIYKVFGSVLPGKGELTDSFVVTEEDEMELFAQFSAGHFPPPRISGSIPCASVVSGNESATLDATTAGESNPPVDVEPRMGRRPKEFTSALRAEIERGA